MSHRIVLVAAVLTALVAVTTARTAYLAPEEEGEDRGTCKKNRPCATWEYLLEDEDRNEVVLAPGEYVQQADLPILKHKLRIRSESGLPEDTVINCNGHAGFTVLSHLYLEGVSMINCVRNSGGALFQPSPAPDSRRHKSRDEATSSSVTLEECRFRNCTASQSGGALYLPGGASLSSVHLSHCHSGANGGAAWLSNPTQLLGIQVTNSSAGVFGGGLYMHALRRPAPVLDTLTIAGCSAGSRGGGLLVSSNFPLTIYGESVIAENHAGTAAGGLYAAGHEVAWDNAQVFIAHNTAGSRHRRDNLNGWGRCLNCRWASDRDRDGVENSVDNCPYYPNAEQEDSDSNGVGDACEDSDGDWVMDSADNCPSVHNPDQSDIDSDSEGDLCDDDMDGDGWGNNWDNCPSVANPDQNPDICTVPLCRLTDGDGELIKREDGSQGCISDEECEQHTGSGSRCRGNGTCRGCPSGSGCCDLSSNDSDSDDDDDDD